MANWFKIFEVDLDESRMRFALGKLPEVWPVWTGVLMECCKHRSDTVRWGDNEQELFGFSDRLKISIEKVNEAINILCEIQYIEKHDGILKVLKWSEKQDDYLTRKAQGYWEKRRESRKVTVNHSESQHRGEERRGEEKKREEPVGSLVGRLKQRLSEHYGRGESPWTYAEETALVEISRRPDAMLELGELISYQDAMAPEDRKFIPGLDKLLFSWGSHLDRIRKINGKTARKNSTHIPQSERPGIRKNI